MKMSKPLGPDHSIVLLNWQSLETFVSYFLPRVIPLNAFSKLIFPVAILASL